MLEKPGTQSWSNRFSEFLNRQIELFDPGRGRIREEPLRRRGAEGKRTRFFPGCDGPGPNRQLGRSFALLVGG
jgi:hypothetical protein